jgi:hypothetical protein
MSVARAYRDHRFECVEMIATESDHRFGKLFESQADVTAASQIVNNC